MPKHIRILVAVSVLAALLSCTVFGMEFSDVPLTASYYKAVDELSNIGVIQGRGNGTFDPAAGTTREEFCAFLARANGYKENYYTPTELPFYDVDKSGWAYPYISFCYENGYINGVSEHEFRPKDNVTDEQAIKMVVCASGAGDESLSKIGPKWYSGYLNVAQKDGLLDKVNYRVNNNANRAFVAQVVYNAMLYADMLEEDDAEPVQDALSLARKSGTATRSGVIQRASSKPKKSEQKTEQQPVIVEDIWDPGYVANEGIIDKSDPHYEIIDETPVERPVFHDGTLIVLDPGHNYNKVDTGATGFGMREQDITFQIAAKTKPLLEKCGFHVIMTRNAVTDNVSEESTSASLKERAAIANRAGADLFLSIHCNASSNPAPDLGTETYYYTGSPAGKVLAQCLQKNVTQTVGIKSRGVKSAEFAVLRYTTMVAALLETAFITSEGDAEKLKDPAYQQKFAEGIARGLCEYFDIEYVA